MCNCGSPQCTLPIATNARNGTMGPSSFYSRLTPATGNAQVIKTVEKHRITRALKENAAWGAFIFKYSL